ncbi:hypothetical protein OHB54_45360 [Streptomyces sp. NBC_01007]|nr:hypothetical protein OHB54_45360 [Streptomyces sp. NBC_01007]
MAQPTVLPVIDTSRLRDPGMDRDAFLAELRPGPSPVKAGTRLLITGGDRSP